MKSRHINKLIFLLIAHTLQNNQYKALGIQGIEIDSTGIVSSASDGENSYSFNVLSYMEHPSFRLYRTTKYGIEYFMRLLTINTFPSHFRMSCSGVGRY